MNERPTRNDLTLTREECSLCILYVALWNVVFVLALVSPRDSIEFVRELAHLISKEVAPLLNGKLPVLSVDNFQQLIAVSFLIGAAILGALHLAYLVKIGRWLRPVTLWFWTMLHALLPVLYMLVLAGEGLLKKIGTGHSHLDADFFLEFAFVLILFLPVFYISRSLWRRRRVKEKLRAE